MIERLLDRLSQTCIFLSSIAMVVLVAMFGWLVFGRYVLNSTPTWVEQLALVLVVYITFLGAAAGIHEDSHLGVTFMRESMPRPIRNVLRIAGDLALAVFGAVMLVACLELVEFGWDTRLPMLGIPESIRTLPSAICGGLMLLFAGTRALLRIHRYYISSDPAVDDAEAAANVGIADVSKVAAAASEPHRQSD